MTMTVTEMIGDTYKDWIVGNRKQKVEDNEQEVGDSGQEVEDSEPKYRRETIGRTVFITSPTGSGKTFFILHTLLPFCYENNKNILYLVNRKILKEQIEEEILCFVPEYKDMIHVELYQNIEKKIKKLKWKIGITNETYNVIYNDIYSNYYNKSTINDLYNIGIMIDLAKYDCVVCDECHYFLADANYNTNTDLSLRWILNTFVCKTKIFMSATIADIKHYIEDEEEKEKHLRTTIYGFPFRMCSVMDILYDQVNEYPNSDQKREYSYIDINIIKRDEIANTVSSTQLH